MRVQGMVRRHNHLKLGRYHQHLHELLEMDLSPLDYMMKKFPDCKLLFTDTDSFCYKIPDVEDVYATIKDSDWFDFSNFPKDHPNYKENNKMIPGKFKDECPNNTILEFVGLRSKMYSILPKEGEKKATAKGVNQRITRNVIKHGDYRNCHMNDEQMYHEMVNIAHDHHSWRLLLL